MGPGRPAGARGGIQSCEDEPEPSAWHPGPNPSQGRAHPGADSIPHLCGQPHLCAPLHSALRAVWGCGEDPSQAGPYRGAMGPAPVMGLRLCFGILPPVLSGCCHNPTHGLWLCGLGKLPARWRWGDPRSPAPDELLVASTEERAPLWGGRLGTCRLPAGEFTPPLGTREPLPQPGAVPFAAAGPGGDDAGALRRRFPPQFPQPCLCLPSAAPRPPAAGLHVRDGERRGERPCGRCGGCTK